MSNENLMVMPAVTPEQAKKSWAEYQELKESVKTSEDIQLIQGKEFLKKSYWRKIARFFNLSVELVEEKSEQFEGGVIAYHFKAKATAPNGAFAEGVGSCDTGEKGLSKSIHNTRTIAETRAWNRAVSNLVGGGEVSAEEIQQDNGNTVPSKTATPKSNKPSWVIGKCQCGGDLCKSKTDPNKYYCSNYKEGCKVVGLVDEIIVAETTA